MQEKELKKRGGNLLPSPFKKIFVRLLFIFGFFILIFLFIIFVLLLMG